MQVFKGVLNIDLLLKVKNEALESYAETEEVIKVSLIHLSEENKIQKKVEDQVRNTRIEEENET